MKGPEDALVDEAEVVVAPLDHRRLRLMAHALHHDCVGLEQNKMLKLSLQI
jgi:hypothetical protein